MYLIIGTPLLLWYLRRNDGDPNALAALAFKVMVFSLLLVAVIAAITGDKQVFGVGLWFTGFGMIFGPAWAYFFGLSTNGCAATFSQNRVHFNSLSWS